MGATRRPCVDLRAVRLHRAEDVGAVAGAASRLDLAPEHRHADVTPRRAHRRRGRPAVGGGVVDHDRVERSVVVAAAIT